MRALSIQILEAGGDYIWWAKDNQQNLHRDIEQHFQPAICGAGSRPMPTDFQRRAQTAIGHGRIEVRTLTTRHLVQDYRDWPGVAQVFKLERRVMDLHWHPLRQQVVYGLTSLAADEADPWRSIDLTRGYAVVPICVLCARGIIALARLNGLDRKTIQCVLTSAFLEVVSFTPS